MNTLSSLCDIKVMFAMYDNYAVDSLIIDDNSNEKNHAEITVNYKL